jgi:hypothetical protein
MIIRSLKGTLMMNMVLLRVVGGTSVGDAPRLPTREDVRKEAARRLGALGYAQHNARALATGANIPARIRALALQINFVADSISALDVIPADFQSDVYWPSLLAEVD